MPRHFTRKVVQTDVSPSLLLLMVPCYYHYFHPVNPGPLILKTQIEGLFLYPSGMMERGIVLATSPGRHIENIAVTVQQPYIRGRVQHIDETPIVNTKVRLRLRTVSLHGNSSSDRSVRTDTEGYFRYYAERDLEGPTFYMLSVTHQGQTSKRKTDYP